jgi:peptide/nickel transport system ATP-binding protein
MAEASMHAACQFGRRVAIVTGAPYVAIRNLGVTFRAGAARVRAVSDVTLDVRAGEAVALIGESGSGKSVTMRAIMRLNPESRTAIAGSIAVGGQDAMAMDARRLSKFRGGEVAMIFQEPLLALDPVYTLGEQIVETIRRHEPVSRAEARARALELFERVRIPSAARRLDAYPHEMSGGMRQRAMIALALSRRRGCCWPTSRRRRSTPPCRSRCCFCCGSFGASWGCRSCSSPTTSARRWRSPTASRSCMAGASSRRRRRAT